MVVSLGVLAAGIGVFVLLLPKHHHDPVMTVDVQSELSVLVNDAPFTVLAPQGLPAQWRATSIRTSVPDQARSGAASLHIGYVVDRRPRTYAALEESNGPADTFVRQQLGSTVAAGTVSVAGESYTERRNAGGYVSLARTAGGVTVVATGGGRSGGAILADLEVLVGSLRPQHRTT